MPLGLFIYWSRRSLLSKSAWEVFGIGIAFGVVIACESLFHARYRGAGFHEVERCELASIIGQKCRSCLRTLRENWRFMSMFSATNQCHALDWSSAWWSTIFLLCHLIAIKSHRLSQAVNQNTLVMFPYSLLIRALFCFGFRGVCVAWGLDFQVLWHQQSMRFHQAIHAILTHQNVVDIVQMRPNPEISKKRMIGLENTNFAYKRCVCGGHPHNFHAS